MPVRQRLREPEADQREAGHERDARGPDSHVLHSRSNRSRRIRDCNRLTGSSRPLCRTTM
jgi:hypothetical protein